MLKQKEDLKKLLAKAYGMLAMARREVVFFAKEQRLRVLGRVKIDPLLQEINQKLTKKD